MANFNTHLLGGTVASGMLTSSILLTGLFNPGQGMAFWVAGIIASLAPDLDADTTAILRGLFNALGMMASFFILFTFPELPLLFMWGAMLAAFLCVRFGLLKVFASLTEHRGSFHSLLAAVSFDVTRSAKFDISRQFWPAGGFSQLALHPAGYRFCLGIGPDGVCRLSGSPHSG
ncbi:MAG: hypothetical protein ACPHXW_02085 [Marinobacterium sp.]